MWKRPSTQSCTAHASHSRAVSIVHRRLCSSAPAGAGLGGSAAGAATRAPDPPTACAGLTAACNASMPSVSLLASTLYLVPLPCTSTLYLASTLSWPRVSCADPAIPPPPAPPPASPTPATPLPPMPPPAVKQSKGVPSQRVSMSTVGEAAST